MGEKEGNGDENKKNGGGGGADLGKKDAVVVVLKVDFHCEGCATKIKKAVRGLQGVETATVDLASGKLEVTGKAVDPWKLRDLVEEKTRKKVEIISPNNLPPPPPKKKVAAAAMKSDEPAAVSTTVVVLKIRLHCEGCVQMIRKSILKVKGVQSVSIDAAKDLVTVQGTMKDPARLPEVLKGKLRRNVEIVPEERRDCAADEGRRRREED